MLRLMVVVVALVVGCSKKNQEEECLKGNDTKLCMAAADGMRGKESNARIAGVYSHACSDGDMTACLNAADFYAADKFYDSSAPRYEKACVGKIPAACVGLGRAYREGQGVASDVERARQMFKTGCDLKDDASCKELAALPAAKPVDAGVPPDAAPVATPVPPGDDKMTDLAYCGFMMTQFCTRCAPAHSVTVESCVKSQSADACAGLTGKQMIDTPAEFRTKCAAAIATMDCNQKNGGLPPECAPPAPSEPAVAAEPMPGSVKSLLADKMDDASLCTVIVNRVCSRCGTADEMGCYQNQGHTACAALTGREHMFKTPAAFRDRCLAALGKLDCKQKDAGTPVECIPPKP